MLNDIVIGVIAGVATAFLFWLASRQPKKQHSAELKDVLDEGKVKGRFE